VARSLLEDRDKSGLDDALARSDEAKAVNAGRCDNYPVFGVPQRIAHRRNFAGDFDVDGEGGPGQKCTAPS